MKKIIFIVLILIVGLAPVSARANNFGDYIAGTAVGQFIGIIYDQVTGRTKQAKNAQKAIEESEKAKKRYYESLIQKQQSQQVQLQQKTEQTQIKVEEKKQEMVVKEGEITIDQLVSKEMYIEKPLMLAVYSPQGGEKDKNGQLIKLTITQPSEIQFYLNRISARLWVQLIGPDGPKGPKINLKPIEENLIEIASQKFYVLDIKIDDVSGLKPGSYRLEYGVQPEVPIASIEIIIPAPAAQ